MEAPGVIVRWHVDQVHLESAESLSPVQEEHTCMDEPHVTPGEYDKKKRSSRSSGRQQPVRMGGSTDAPAALVPRALCDAPCNAPRDAANWAGARFAETTTINSDSPDQLDCMAADDFEPMDNVGLSGSTPVRAALPKRSTIHACGHPCPHFMVSGDRRSPKEFVVATNASTFHQSEHRHGTRRPRLPRLPVEDHKVIFRIRGGISILQEAVLPLRAAIQTALRTPLPVRARIRVRKEQNIALVSTSDPDFAVQLCHVQTLKLGSRSYEVSAYVASPDNSCKGVITGALPIPTEDALINDTVT
ncbi:hypothetical protein HPB51_006159 [Rhipicephalus microplus]|uniref:Uncharacterized protein n=1 Tax=Rhipicephalus microplus TaxID=6941 RepID=A0A9J6E763_RHIMP|nr:hypothetical protein HPB51_006159 [Rhipicephalus microplus]